MHKVANEDMQPYIQGVFNIRRASSRL